MQDSEVIAQELSALSHKVDALEKGEPADGARFVELLADLCDIDVGGIARCLDRVVERRRRRS
jgi:hypothetical protein